MIFCICLNPSLYQWALSFICFCAVISYPFIVSWRTPFSIFWKAGLRVVNALSFGIFLFSPLFWRTLCYLKHSSCQFFCHTLYTISLFLGLHSSCWENHLVVFREFPNMWQSLSFAVLKTLFFDFCHIDYNVFCCDFFWFHPLWSL